MKLAPGTVVRIKKADPRRLGVVTDIPAPTSALVMVDLVGCGPVPLRPSALKVVHPLELLAQESA